MPNIQININENKTTTLATAGKYCADNIDIVTAVPSVGGVYLSDASVSGSTLTLTKLDKTVDPETSTTITFTASDSILWCTSSTTYGDITTALSSSKIPVYKSGNTLYFYTGTGTNSYIFSRTYGNTISQIEVTSSGWGSVVSSVLELNSNKASTINASSQTAATDFPTVSAVATYVQNEISTALSASY